jgi:polyisoprenoid-binding protein YceI
MTTANANETGASGQSATGPLPRPTTWQLDADASAVTFSHKTMWGLATVRGKFTDVSGTAEIVAEGTAHGRLEIGAASVDTKNRKRDQHLRSADFFDAAAHPTIVVDVTRAAPAADAEVQATGTLTVAGRTRPLAVTAVLAGASGQEVTLTADAEIDRADFGMTWNQLGMLKGPAHVRVVAKFVNSAMA